MSFVSDVASASALSLKNHRRVLRLVSRATLRGFVRCQNISAGHSSAIEGSSVARVLGAARIILVARFQIEAGCADWPLDIGGWLIRWHAGWLIR